VVRDRNQARVTEVMRGLGDEPPARILLRAVIAALLPLDDATRDDGRVALAFLAYTAVRPDAAEPLREDTKLMTGFLAGLIPGPNAEPAAAGLLALMEGLGVYLLGGQFTAGQALDALDAHLDLLFAGNR
jgi:hypothetical protein